MYNIDKQYLNLLQDILDNGVKKEDRTGTNTLSVFGRQIRHKMSEGFPLLTTKRMAFKSIITELIWFIMGGMCIRFLWKNNCHIWDGDWYKSYTKSCSYPHSLEEMIKFGLEWDDNPRGFHKDIWDLGPVYGKQWRSWGRNATREEKIVEPGVYTKQIDQIENLINELKNNPDSRRMMVSAWNVGELDEMVLPPCHYAFQVYTRELSLEDRMKLSERNMKIIPGFDSHFGDDEEVHLVLDTWNIPKRAISLMFNMRSSDAFLGLPFNIASYGALLMMLADEMQMVPDELIGNLGDTHLYLNHIEQAKEQISREPFPLPTLKVEDGMYCRHVENFYLENYQSHSTIKAQLSN